MTIPWFPCWGRVPWWIGLALVLSGLLRDRPISAQTPGDLKDRFLKEAPKKWREYRAFAARLQGSISGVHEYIGPFRPSEKGRWEFKQNKQCALVSIEYTSSGRIVREVLAFNPNYGFRLYRNEAGNDWVLTGVEKDNIESIQFAGMPVSKLVSDQAMLAFALYGRQLQSLLDHPQFKVTRAEQVNRAGQDLVQVDFDFPHDPKEQPFNPIRSGSIWLNPNEYWCVTEYKVKGEWGNGNQTCHMTREFKTVSGKPVLLREVEIERADPPYGPAGATGIKRIGDFDLEAPKDLPADQDFTLSAFGLPEPFLGRNTTTRWYIWAGIAGIVCLVGGLSVRQFRRGHE
jgi:hypothetical protein